MKYATLIYVLLTFNNYCFGQTIQSLIVAEYLKDSSGMGSYTFLTSYNFQEGKLLSKDTLFDAPVTRENVAGSYIRFDLGRNFIYKNRYLISSNASVIDIVNRTLVVNAQANFVKTIGDTLIFYRNNLFTGTGFLMLDLNTRDYKFIEDAHFMPIKGLKSPDCKHALEINREKIPYDIYINNEKQASKIIVQSAGASSVLSGSFRKIPMLWLDDTCFIYAKDFSSSDFFNNKVEIRTINIDNQLDTLITTIDSIPYSNFQSSFYRDALGSLIFDYVKGNFVVDLKKKAIVSYRNQEIGHQFQVEIEEGTSGRNIKYKEEIIGRFRCLPYFSKTTNGYFATQYDATGDRRYEDGIKVWNTFNKTWLTLNIPWVCAIIGWIQK